MTERVFAPDLSLNRDQEQLLRTALSSNPRASPRGASINTNSKSTDQSANQMANGADVYPSPVQDLPGSATFESFDESPFLDQELDDGTFDWDNSGDQLFGDLPGADFNDDGEHHEKRKASTDEDEEEGTSKRREGNEKNAKKPGRKPLTGEPTTKRKAQNRAAQRAFRERKERHLKDLETKVEDLEKSSEATNHENGRLRAQVEKLSNEVKEYRKRLSVNNAGGGPSPPLSSTQSRNYFNPNDFQFAFPKFGDLPSSFMNNGSMAKTSLPTQLGQQSSASASNPSLPGMNRKESSSSINAKSPTSTNGSFAAPPANSLVNDSMRSTNVNFSNEDLTGLFSPSVLATASRSNSADYVSFPGGNVAAQSNRNGAMGSATNEQGQNPGIQQRDSSTSLLASPISTLSQSGLDSSAGTTPESSAESPDNRKASEGGLNTINEENSNQSKTDAANLFKSPGSEVNGIDWLAQQNGGNFDPVLWGDYRESQDNFLNNSFDNFFSDAFQSPADFTSPYNTGELLDPPQSQQQPQKRTLMDDIELQQNGDAGQDKSSALSDPNPKQYLTCEKLWDRVQSSEKVKSGAADMDDLCSQLKAKATCSGSGAVIEQKEVDRILGPAPTEQQDFLKMFS